MADWARCLQIAQRLGMAYEAAAAEFELARAGQHDEEANVVLRRALSTFRSMEATRDSALVETALGR